MSKIYKKESLFSKNGYEIFTINNLFIHSKYDPIREAEVIVEKNFTPDVHYLLFGYGKGYIFNKLLMNIKESTAKILIIDPFFDVTNLQGEKFKGVTINQITESFLLHYFGTTKEIKCIISPNYDKLCPVEVKKVLKILKDFISIKRISNNTIRKDALMWNLNYINNLYYLPRDKSIKILNNKFNLPVVIASGGPSLQKQLQLLKRNREKCILIAAGSTINSLLAAEIEPDFLISVDGKNENLNHYKDLNMKNTIFVYSFQSFSGIREVINQPSLYFLGEDMHNQKVKLEDTFKTDFACLSGGGSVANYALTFARYISSGPIALLGQDLAYTDSKSHADNNIGQVQIDESFIAERKAFYTEGYYENEKVLTDYAFFSMKRSFEHLMEILPQIKTIFNCTEGGINIEKMNKISFLSFIENYMKNSNHQFDLNLLKKDILKPSQDYSSLLKFFKEELKELNKLKSLLKNNLRILGIDRGKNYYSSNNLKQLDINDKKINKISVNTCISPAMSLINLEVLTRFKQGKNETNLEKFQRVNNQSEFLYKSILELSEKVSDEINKIISKIKFNTQN